MNRTLGYDARQQQGKIPRCVIVEEAALVDRDIYDVCNARRVRAVANPDTQGKSGYLYDKHEHSNDWASFENETADNPLGFH